MHKLTSTILPQESPSERCVVVTKKGSARATSQLLWLLLASISHPLYAQGGPPLLTDDPGTPGDGVWEINLALTAERSPGERLFEAPLLDINYGVGERIQLKFEVAWLFLDGEGESTKNGLGNSEVGVKWRFLDQETHFIDMSVYPQFTFDNPTSSADRGIVEEGTELFLPFQIQRGFGPFSVNPEVGYLFRQRGGDRWAYGLALGYEPVEGLQLLGEIHGESDDELKNHDLVFNLGLRWGFSERVGLLLAAGRGLRGAAADEPELLMYAGFQFMF